MLSQLAENWRRVLDRVRANVQNIIANARHVKVPLRVGSGVQVIREPTLLKTSGESIPEDEPDEVVFRHEHEHERKHTLPRLFVYIVTTFFSIRYT
jgi:hypothetical protein